MLACINHHMWCNTLRCNRSRGSEKQALLLAESALTRQALYYAVLRIRRPIVPLGMSPNHLNWLGEAARQYCTIARLPSYPGVLIHCYCPCSLMSSNMGIFFARSLYIPFFDGAHIVVKSYKDYYNVYVSLTCAAVVLFTFVGDGPRFVHLDLGGAGLPCQPSTSRLDQYLTAAATTGGLHSPP